MRLLGRWVAPCTYPTMGLPRAPLAPTPTLRVLSHPRPWMPVPRPEFPLLLGSIMGDPRCPALHCRAVAISRFCDATSTRMESRGLWSRAWVRCGRVQMHMQIGHVSLFRLLERASSLVSVKVQGILLGIYRNHFMSKSAR